MNDSSNNWEKLLDPDILRPSLLSATLYITSFEVLKSAIVDRTKSFYCVGWVEGDPQPEPAYKAEVLDRHRSPLYASLDWLLENSAIDDEDLKTFETLKRTRNIIAHQLLEVVTGQVQSNHQQELETLIALLRKIEVWWVVNVEIPTNPDFDDREIHEHGIVPGSILSLQMLVEVASGNSELLVRWRQERAKMSSRTPC